MCTFVWLVVHPKLSSHCRHALCTNWWAPACTNCQLIVASGEGGAAEKLAKPRLVTDVDANCGFLITPPLPTAFSVLQLYVHCTRNELKLRPCIIISTASQCRLPLLQGKAIWRSEPSSYGRNFYQTQVSLGSGLWVPVSVSNFLRHLWLRLCWWWYQLNTGWWCSQVPRQVGRRTWLLMMPLIGRAIQSKLTCTISTRRSPRGSARWCRCELCEIVSSSKEHWRHIAAAGIAAWLSGLSW